MNFIKLALSSLFFCYFLLQLTMPVAYAQDPVEEEPPAPDLPPSGTLEFTFADLGRSTFQLQADDASRLVRFDLPDNLLISPTVSYVDLVMSHFPAVPEKPARLDVTVDSNLMAAIPFTDEISTQAPKRIFFSADTLTTKRGNLTLKIDTSGTCNEPGTPFTLVVDESSTLSVNYQQTAYPTDLRLYPFPFSERGLVTIPTTIILPDQPTSNDLSAAATIASGLGQATNGSIELSVATVSRLTPDIQANNHLIIIGSPETNPLLAELALPLDIDEDVVEPGFGVLQEVISPWNEFRLVLVVSGLDDEGVGKASIALNRRAHFLGMQGPVAIVVELGDLSENLPFVEADSFTFETLDYDPEAIYGVEPEVLDYVFSMPLEWRLDNPPFFHLKFSHAKSLDPTRSAISINLNGLPLGSAILNEENAVDGELVISLPPNQLKSGRNTLSIQVDMELLDTEHCIGRTDTRAWTVISNESEIFLPYTQAEVEPVLRYFPFPFSNPTGVDDTLIVVPDEPDEIIINQVIRIAGLLGGTSRTEKLTVPILFDSEVNDTIRENNHLILLGRPTQNTLLSEVNNQLPHPFIRGTDVLLPLAIDRVVFLADPERNAGLLEVIDSPWSDSHVLLAVTGTTDGGVALAFEALATETNRLNGNLAVVEPAPDIVSEDKLVIYAAQTNKEQAAGNTSAQPTGTLSTGQSFDLGERWWK